jgi:anti-sigma regulatory factor (Ser/Thr protein kinase)
MEMTTAGGVALALRVEESSQIGEVRRTAAALAAEAGFTEARSGQLAIVATELGTNLVKHGGGGEVLLRRLEAEQGVEIMALDRGAGMRDVAESFRDGYSTAGTAGNGLGAVARLADRWDVYSTPEAGTAVVAQFGAPSAAAALDIGAVCLALHGETVSGDAWSAVHESDRSVFIVADGLGHGPGAQTAAAAAIQAFLGNAGGTPAQIIDAAHLALRSTRGAAVGVAELDRRRRVIRFAGVGNIAGTIVAGGATRSFVSHGGIVGHECRRVHEFDYEWPAGALLILHSDGLQTSWKLSRYPGLERRHPALLAGVLYRDYTRGRDDVTVLAVREMEPAA